MVSVMAKRRTRRASASQPSIALDRRHVPGRRGDDPSGGRRDPAEAAGGRSPLRPILRGGLRGGTRTPPTYVGALLCFVSAYDRIFTEPARGPTRNDSERPPRAV